MHTERQTIVLKDWLEKEGINTNYWWEQCKRENNGWEGEMASDRSELLTKSEPCCWIGDGFDFDKADIQYSVLEHLDEKWYGLVINHPEIVPKLGFKFEEGEL